MIKIEIVNGPIDFFPNDGNRNDDGAELVFNRKVRSTENGGSITALEYEQYEGMAEAELTSLANEVCEKYPIHDLFCRHRIGIVNEGETSLHVPIWSKHRKEGLNALTWFKTNSKNEFQFGNGLFLKMGKEYQVNVHTINY